MNINLFSEVLFCVWVIALIVILFIVVKYYRRVHYRLNSLSETIKRTQGGVNKRISENRELLELIKDRKQHPLFRYVNPEYEETTVGGKGGKKKKQKKKKYFIFIAYKGMSA